MNSGSVLGGTYLEIDGLYFYTDSTVSANIRIGDQPCEIIDFQLNDTINTKLTCKTPAKPQSLASEYAGGRGVNLIVDSQLTAFDNLRTVQPSANAQQSYIDKASYTYAANQDVTVWFKGFISPGKSSNYIFSLVSNGDAILYLSTSNSSSNKVNLKKIHFMSQNITIYL